MYADQELVTLRMLDHYDSLLHTTMTHHVALRMLAVLTDKQILLLDAESGIAVAVPLERNRQ